MADANTNPVVPEQPSTDAGVNWGKIAAFGVSLIILFIIFFVVSKGIKLGQA